MKKILGFTTSLVFVLSSCGLPTETAQESQLMNVKLSPSTSLSNEQGAQQLDAFCAPERSASYFSTIANRVDFQAGYVQHFAGSGYSYKLAKKQALDNSQGWFREGQGKSYSRNGMGMYPPSQDYNHFELFKTSCAVAKRSLLKADGYDQVTASLGSAAGTAAYGKVQNGDCLIVKMVSTRNRRNSEMAFCKAAFVSTSESRGSGAASKMAYVIQ